jgi:CheY-like chemotaxis protein
MVSRLSAPPKRILLVDDDRDTRSWLVEYLVELGYDAHVALDGDHALRSAIALGPDLILLDVFLPRPKFALDFATRYRDRVPAEKRAPIIAMSASADLPALAQQIGANDTLTKPFELGVIARVLAKFLDDPVETAIVDAPEPSAPELTPQPETGPA